MQLVLFGLGFILFIGLILAHEWGHLVAARRAGVKVKEFGLGFPPRATSRKLKSGMVLSLNWLPLGGFVRLKGEHSYDDRPGSFGAARLKSKVKILLAGVAANLAIGLVLLTILAATGLPTIFDKSSAGQDQFNIARDSKLVKTYVYVQDIQPGSPAAQAGLVDQDVIESVATASQTRVVSSTDQLRQATMAFGGQKVMITIKHKNKQEVLRANLLSPAIVKSSLNSNQPKGYLGVVTTDIQVRRSTWSAPIVAVGLTGQLAELTAKGIWHAIQGLGSTVAGGISRNHIARENGQTEASSQTGGPVAVAAILWSSGALGINFVVMVIAVVSLTLALINALPIPALDGGRLFIILLFKLIKRPLKPSTEDRIHGTRMTVLLVLFALITIVDVKRFF